MGEVSFAGRVRSLSHEGRLFLDGYIAVSRIWMRRKPLGGLAGIAAHFFFELAKEGGEFLGIVAGFCHRVRTQQIGFALRGA